MPKHSYEAIPIDGRQAMTHPAIRVSGRYVSRDNFITYRLSRKGRPGTRYAIWRHYPGVGWLAQGEYVVPMRKES